MVFISKKPGSAILIAGLVLVLSLGVIFPQDVHARVERDIEITEGDPGDGYESGGGSGGNIVPPPNDRDQIDGSNEIDRLDTFNNSFVFLNLTPFFDGQKLVWAISFSHPPFQGGKN